MRRTRNSDARSRDSGFEFEVVGCTSRMAWGRPRGFGVRNSGFGIRDSGFGIRNSNFDIYVYIYIQIHIHIRIYSYTYIYTSIYEGVGCTRRMAWGRPRRSLSRAGDRRADMNSLVSGFGVYGFCWGLLFIV